MSKQPKLYYDITQLAHWPDKLTGIPRVMHEIALRFRHTNDPAILCVVWVKELQTFCLVDFDKTMAERGKGIAYLPANGLNQAAPQSRPATAHFKKQAIQFAKKGIGVAKRLHPKLGRAVESRVQQMRLQNYRQATFEKGDKLFIPWGEWWDESFTSKLLAYRRHGIKLIQVIHDISTTVCPQFFEQVAVSPATYNSAILPKADLVLAVSQNTKRELTEWLRQQKLTVPKIEVFRNGDVLPVKTSTKPTDPGFKESGLKGGDYMLCVGTIEAKKNHLLFYYVYKLAKARGIKLPKLVVAGRKGWMADMSITLMTKDPAVKDYFVFLRNASDEELSWLYDHCLFTVLPSFHEGWGIPIAESLARGVPSLASNTSSMVEIAEGIVGHFSPASTDECLHAIVNLLKPPELKEARALTKQYQPFSWDDSFKQITKYLEDV